jgi:hypothetical protein
MGYCIEVKAGEWRNWKRRRTHLCHTFARGVVEVIAGGGGHDAALDRAELDTVRYGVKGVKGVEGEDGNRRDKVEGGEGDEGKV